MKMERPNLTQADLDEVDRLLALANACRSSDLLFQEQSIKASALSRAAEILGVMPEPAVEEVSIPTGPAAVFVKPGTETEFSE